MDKITKLRNRPVFKWCLILAALAGLIAVMVIAGRTIKYRASGGIIIHNAFHGLTGRLIYLKGRWPQTAEGELTLPPAAVWSYDLVTKEKVKLMDVKQAGELVVSADGIWIGIIFDNGEILVSSPAKGYTHTFKFSPAEGSERNQAVIVNGRLCVKSGSRYFGGQRVDIIELETQRSIQAEIPKTTESAEAGSQTLYMNSRMADTNHLFVISSGLWPSDGGLYMCDLDTGAATRIGSPIEFYDYSYAGDYVGWDQVLGGLAWAVKTYKATEGTGKSVDREHGREVCRFYGPDCYHLTQVSPCLRYALVGGSFITGNGMDSIYYLCDLKTGQKKLFIDAKPSKVERGAFIGGIHWVK